MPDLTVAENVFLGKQPVERLRRRRLARAWRASAKRAARRSRHRRRPAHAHGRAADRPAAAHRDRPRAVLRRAHHHPGRADLGALAARGRAAVRACCGGCGTAAAASSSSRISSTTSCAISDAVTVFRNGRKVADRAPAAGIDKRWVIERMIGARPRGARGELYRRHPRSPAEPTRRSCWKRTASRLGRAYRDVSLEVHAGEVLGIYGFMGCGQLELAAHLVRQAEAGQRIARRSTASRVALASTATRAQRRRRLRAGKPARDALPPRAGLQEHVDRHPRAHLAPLAEAGGGAARSRRGTWSACSIRPPRVDPLLGSFPAATSRRWRWRNG